MEACARGLMVRTARERCPRFAGPQACVLCSVEHGVWPMNPVHDLWSFIIRFRKANMQPNISIFFKEMQHIIKARK